jgi:hypothetical protein
LNQNPEQLALDNIDQQLPGVGWVIQYKRHNNWSAASGVTVRQCENDIGSAVDNIFANAFKNNLSSIKLISSSLIKILKSHWKKNKNKSVQVGY